MDKGKYPRDMVETLQKLGFEIEAATMRWLPANMKLISSIRMLQNHRQYYDFPYSGAHGCPTAWPACHIHAKPLFGVAGSGMHLHISLFKNGENAFYDADDPEGLSDTCRYFIAGVMKHARAITAITNPTVNSYKRLVPGYEAPIYIAWSHRNRSPLIRVPARRGIGTRIEVRSPDPTCNPYLGLAVILKAGLEGIKNREKPLPPVDRNIYEMNLADRKLNNIESLPENLYEAISELNRDEVIQQALGQHIHSRFCYAKIKEWENYSSRVYQWEIDEYLEKF